MHTLLHVVRIIIFLALLLEVKTYVVFELSGPENTTYKEIFPYSDFTVDYDNTTQKPQINGRSKQLSKFVVDGWIRVLTVVVVLTTSVYCFFLLRWYISNRLVRNRTRIQIFWDFLISTCFPCINVPMILSILRHGIMALRRDMGREDRFALLFRARSRVLPLEGAQEPVQIPI